MHLVDHSRAWIEQRYRRPWIDRTLRAVLAWLLPYPRRFAFALMLGRVFSPLRGLLPKRGVFRSMRAMLELASKPQGAVSAPLAAAPAAPRARIAFLEGCAEPILQPGIQQAATRLLARMDIEVVPAPGQGCCGALVHHLGRDGQSAAFARANVDAWSRVIESGGGLDAIVVTASGCGTSLRDYGFLLRDDPAYAERAARVSLLARDVSEVVAQYGLPTVTARSGEPLRVAYHAACSLQHGQRVREPPPALLMQAGFTLTEVPDAHLCCGSAGVYNILQPELAGTLRTRKLTALASGSPQLVATGNIGCLTQLSQNAGLPVVHTVELLDWATGGPKPAALA
jgi:glycolate oxidase iron-sulfur subunit